MAYTITGNSGKVAYGLKHFTCDTIDDLNSLSLQEVIPGSVAYVISESKSYKLDHNKVWQPITSSGGGGGGSDEPDVESVYIYDGGVI